MTAPYTRPLRRAAAALAATLSLTLTVPAGASPLFRGTFRAYSPLGPGTNCVAIEDFNGDGRLDVAVGSNGANSIAILLNAGQGEFQPPSYLTSRDDARAIVVADLNADGYQDLVVGYRFADHVSVFLGFGDGTFGGATDYASGRESHSVAIGDVDRDGRLDLVVGNGETFYGRSISVLRGNGDGTFQPKVDSTMGNVSPSAVALADFNGDGFLDVIAGYEGGATAVYVMLGLGGGRFGPIDTHNSGYNPITVDAGDVDQDGRPDFIVGGAWSGDVSIHYGLGAGQFESKVSLPIPGSAFVRLVDVDRDGQLDLLTPGAVRRGRGNRLFHEPVSFRSDRSPESVAFGDLDGDGYLDLVTAHPYPGTISVLLGRGDGSFEGPGPLETAANPSAVAAGDVDHDGRVDIVAACYNDHAVSLLRGDGEGGFPSRTDIVDDFAPHDIALVDLNRDGSLDLVTQSFGTISTRLGSGTGAFGPRRDSPGRRGAQWMATGDFNGDEWPDVVTANFGTNENVRPWRFVPDTTVSIFFGAGDGTLGNRIDLTSGGAPLDVKVADMNRDGNLDVIAANPRGATVSILLGNGDGTFHARMEFPAGPYPTVLALGDFDSDGVLDVAVVGSSSGEIIVLLGNGDGSLHAGGTIPGSGITRWIGAGDWDRDGRIDLAAMYESGNTVRLLMNRGGGQFEPAEAYGTGIGPEHGLVADLNGDGHADIASADFSGNSVTVMVSARPALATRRPTRRPAVIAPLESAETWPSRVRLAWLPPRPLGARVTVERMSSGEGWRAMGIAREEGDRLIFEDDSVTPGARYAYHLRGASNDEPLTAEVWVEVPGRAILGLSGLVARSSAAEREIGLTLATTEPARLEVCDLAGRRMLLRDFRGMEPGPHRIALAETAAWRAGIYFARLVQGTASARAKWCLLR